MSKMDGGFDRGSHERSVYLRAPAKYEKAIKADASLLLFEGMLLADQFKMHVTPSIGKSRQKTSYA